MPALNGDQLPAQSRNWGRPGYGPNPKENTQGMLFSNAHAVNKETRQEARTGDEPGHKGYSVNRLNAVREKIPVDVHLSNPAAYEAIKARHGGEINPAYGIQTTDRDIAQRMTAGHIHDVVARSTMPEEHLQGLPETRIRTLDLSPVAGSFNRMTGGVSLNASGLEPERQWGADTVIHELGHAVDASNVEQPGYGKPRRLGRRAKPPEEYVPPSPVPGVTTNSGNPMSSPERAASGEGFADAYLLKHSRGRGGREVDRSAETLPYETFGQKDWEGYAGFHPDPQISPQERGPKAYAEALELHGGKSRARQLSLFPES
jgi:hypothetical protein